MWLQAGRDWLAWAVVAEVLARRHKVRSLTGGLLLPRRGWRERSTCTATSVVYSTQFHNLVAGIFSAGAKVGVIPAFRGVSFQTISTADVARVLIGEALVDGKRGGYLGGDCRCGNRHVDEPRAIALTDSGGKTFGVNSVLGYLQAVEDNQR